MYFFNVPQSEKINSHIRCRGPIAPLTPHSKRLLHISCPAPHHTSQFQDYHTVCPIPHQAFQSKKVNSRIM